MGRPHWRQSTGFLGEVVLRRVPRGIAVGHGHRSGDRAPRVAVGEAVTFSPVACQVVAVVPARLIGQAENWDGA